MFDKIKSYLKERKVIKKKNKIYNFDETEEKESKKLGKINFLDRIKFIRFKNKNIEKNQEVNIQKIKEVRSFSYSSCAYWNRLY